MTVAPHPLADLFPLMAGAEFDALVTDIREHGLREPIILHEGMILDGRNRYRACIEAAVTPTFEDWDRDGTAQAYVVSKNLHRRHLNESQRAMIGAKLATLILGNVAAQKSGVQISTPPMSAEEAGKLLNVSRHTIQHAKLVQREGTPDEIAAVESGEAAASGIAQQIRAKVPVAERAKKRAEPITQVGKNPERIQRQQINAEIWGRVRDAITHLTSLPDPADVVRIVRANDKGGLVDARLAQSLKWLEDFSNEWSNRGEAAA